jgi:hypothetical protein
MFRRFRDAKAAAAEATLARGTGRPVIRVWGGTLPGVADQAEKALMECDPEIYEFGDELVRSFRDPITEASIRCPSAPWS